MPVAGPEAVQHCRAVVGPNSVFVAVNGDHVMHAHWTIERNRSALDVDAHSTKQSALDSLQHGPVMTKRGNH